jgi:hypothetical protein
MSSAEAMVDETVVAEETGRDGHTTRAATVLAVIALTQLTWLGALVYGGLRLLS